MLVIKNVSRFLIGTSLGSKIKTEHCYWLCWTSANCIIYMDVIVSQCEIPSTRRVGFSRCYFHFLHCKNVYVCECTCLCLCMCVHGIYMYSVYVCMYTNKFIWYVCLNVCTNIYLHIWCICVDVYKQIQTGCWYWHSGTVKGIGSSVEHTMLLKEECKLDISAFTLCLFFTSAEDKDQSKYQSFYTRIRTNPYKIECAQCESDYESETESWNINKHLPTDQSGPLEWWQR